VGAPSIEQKPRRALVLSGGGSKGAFEVGVLQRLMGDEQIDYDLLCGTSVGAINAAYLAQTLLGQPREAAVKLRALWDTVNTEKVHKRWFPFGNAQAFFKPSVYDSEPLHKWIRAGLNVGAVRASGRRLRIVSVSLGTGETFIANEQTPDLPEWVIASSAFPVMLTPASNRRRPVDGRRAPQRDAAGRGDPGGRRRHRRGAVLGPLRQVALRRPGRARDPADPAALRSTS